MQYIARDAACVLAIGQIGKEPSADIEYIQSAMMLESQAHNVYYRHVERPVLHMVFAWHPADRDRIAIKNQIDLAKEGLAFLGLGNHTKAFAAHANEPHPHIHALVSLMDPETWQLAKMETYRRLPYWAESVNKKYHFHAPDKNLPSLKKPAGMFTALLGMRPSDHMEEDLQNVDMIIEKKRQGLTFRQEDGWGGKVSTLPPAWQIALYDRAGMPVSDHVRRSAERLPPTPPICNIVPVENIERAMQHYRLHSRTLAEGGVVPSTASVESQESTLDM